MRAQKTWIAVVVFSMEDRAPGGSQGAWIALGRYLEVRLYVQITHARLTRLYCHAVFWNAAEPRYLPVIRLDVIEITVLPVDILLRR